jgi:hypothetical protein
LFAKGIEFIDLFWLFFARDREPNVVLPKWSGVALQIFGHDLVSFIRGRTGFLLVSRCRTVSPARRAAEARERTEDNYARKFHIIGPEFFAFGIYYPYI